MTLFTIATNEIAKRMSEGGPFMYIILIFLLLSIFFAVMAFVKRGKDETASKKMIGLAGDTCLLALVLGCLGSVVGIIVLFDMVEAVGEPNPALFSGGLKVSMLTIVFGIFAFTIGRLFILAYKWSAPSETAS
ncbi:MotA/TolQ/ExbB proton channel family protein [Winogradskyella maritima]|uniref:MotA/TolQ/ExbB proton channel family protein n=1 Tax=Winogradskyella maritima TaxID=1517766 RepID=A0ABV8ALC5_9FLAO|nr:MotA/TolQ/ExbB proton channel family protein [Winogradskyella maritima]